MNKKHYVKIAKAIKKEHEAIGANIGGSVALVSLMLTLGEIFAEDNERFNKEKFYAACGWIDYENKT